MNGILDLIAETCHAAVESQSRALTTIRGMAKHKRGYSREFPTDQTKRIKREIDWVPPALDRSLRAKLKRTGISLRALTLTLWREWLEREDAEGK